MDHDEKEKIFAALEKVKDICQISETCRECPFSIGDRSCCGFSGSFFPGGWDLDKMTGGKE